MQISDVRKSGTSSDFSIKYMLRAHDMSTKDLAAVGVQSKERDGIQEKTLSSHGCLNPGEKQSESSCHPNGAMQTAQSTDKSRSAEKG